MPLSGHIGLSGLSSKGTKRLYRWTLAIYNTTDASNKVLANGQSGDTPAPIQVRLLTMSPDGSRIASVVADTLCVWDTSTGAVLTEDKKHCYHYSSLKFSPDGTRLIFVYGGSLENPKGHRVSILDVASGEMASHNSVGYVYSATFFPNGTQVLITTAGRLRICDESLTELLTCEMPGGARPWNFNLPG
jgi:WD40 repeat protein